MDKKEQILQAALKLFVEFGFHNTPTSKIAKEAGVANGTLFYFFPTKDDLVKVLYLDVKSRLTNYVTETMRGESTLKEILKVHYTESLRWALEHKTEFLFIEQFNASTYLKQISCEEIEKHTKPFVAILKEGIDNKIIKPMDIGVLFTLIGGHTFAINKYLIDNQLSDSKRTEVINDTFELIWEMIALKGDNL